MILKHSQHYLDKFLFLYNKYKIGKLIKNFFSSLEHYSVYRTAVCQLYFFYLYFSASSSFSFLLLLSYIINSSSWPALNKFTYSIPY